jgi:UDP-N-acetylglucosamine 2-epimerase (non-hydrolysing)
MSEAFFRDLQLPEPHFHLGAGSGSHAAQTAAVMLGYENLCLKAKPDLCVVVGDVNSTLACTLVAAKLHIPVAHLEAGLRSFDRSMPEEINRIMTDCIADLLWTPSLDANENLAREGVPEQKVSFVGNIMIDSLEMIRPAIAEERVAAGFGLRSRDFGVVTLHRPSNVDDPERVRAIVDRLLLIAERTSVVFPVHPRTRQRLQSYGLLSRLERHSRVFLVEPLGYRRFISLVLDASFVLTDSGGLQEETSYFNIPCVTLRSTTERPITISQGTNRLTTMETLVANVERCLREPPQRGELPLWDGRTAERVVEEIRTWGAGRALS